jgi:hypothetical protein
LIHIGPSAALVIAAIVVEIVGIQSGSPLLIAFPFVGLSVARAQLKYWLNAPTEKMHWWYAHMEGMCSACIATITAFLVTAVPRFTDAAIFKSPILWIAPGLILGLVFNRWMKSYRIQFGDAK